MIREEFSAEVRRCEELRRGGRLRESFEAYLELLERRVAGGVAGVFTYNETDLLVIERVADMAQLFGHLEAAGTLLEGMTLLCDRAGNDYYTDYTILKRIDLAFNAGDVRTAEELLGLLEPRVGDVEEIGYTPAGLKRWEHSCVWRNADSDGRKVVFALLYLCVGRRWAAQGCYRRALLMLRQGLTHAAAGAPDLATKARTHLELAVANALLESGDLPGARAALGVLDEASRPTTQPGLLTRRLELNGKLDMLQGRFGGAKENFTRVLRLCVERRLHRGALVASLNLSHIQIYLNQLPLARLSLTAVMAEALRLEDTATAARAEYLLGLAAARGRGVADGKPVAPPVAQLRGGPDARPLADEAANHVDPFDIPQAGSFLTFFEDQTMMFHHLLGGRDVRAAAVFLDKLDGLFGESDSDLIRVRLRVMRGTLDYYLGREQFGGPAVGVYGRAEGRLAEACEGLEALGLKPELWQAQRMLNWCKVRLGREGTEIRRLAERADALLSQMTSSLPAAERFFYVSDKWTFDEEVIGIKLEEISRLQREVESRPRLFSLRGRLKLMRRVHELLHHIDRYKDALCQRTIAGGGEPVPVGPLPFSLWQRLCRHPFRRATLSLLVLPDRLLMIRSGFFSLRLDVRDVERLKVRELVQRWHLAVGGGRAAGLAVTPARRELMRHLIPAALVGGGPPGDNKREIEKISSELAEALSLPTVLKALPRWIQALTIVPDDSLHGFPFAAVRYQGRYLVERFAISSAFESRERRPAAAGRGAKEALLVAVPHGAVAAELPGGRVDIPALKGAVPELENVLSWVRHKTGLRACRSGGFDTRATKESILRHLPAAALFHVACHGFSDVERADQSGLILIPREGKVEVLTLGELAGLALPDLRHATLSSCWSADSFVLPGRWIISLPETLWRAGARSVLGSLWEVKDDIAVAFMEHFYQCLARYPRDRALQETQLACLGRRLLPREPESHPVNYQAADFVNWAGFNLYGEYRALRFGRKGN